ncbi:MAG: bacillithiol biosynthesis BshC [bacterium]
MNYHLEVKKKENFSSILPEGTFLGGYAQNPSGFPQFFHFNPGQIGEKITSLRNQPFPHREALVEYLCEYHQSLGASPETMCNIADLRDQQSLVIMTGQQPGLLTGPLYTIYKTIACLWEAQRIRQTFSRPCIPVFWIASEDHNLAEAASISWPDPHDSSGDSICKESGHGNSSHARSNGAGICGGGSSGGSSSADKSGGAGSYSTLSICPRRGHFKQPIGLLPLNPEGKELSSFMRKLRLLFGTTMYSREVDRIIQSTLQNTLTRSGTLGEWFSRLMLEFFGSCGLVLFEPNDVRIKRLTGSIRQKVLADPPALPIVVDRTGQELEQCGYRRQLPSYPDRCPFFLYEKAKGDWMPGERVTHERVTRERVTWDGRLFHTQNQDYSPEQLRELLQYQPERFSPNVYLRPVFSESLFPTLMYLAGPGEVGYFAQIKGVYEYFGLKMPIILPRFSATLRDPQPASLLRDVYPQERRLNIFYLLNAYGPDFIRAIQSLEIESYFFHYHLEVIAS